MIDKMLPIGENGVKWRVFTVQLYNTALAVTNLKKIKTYFCKKNYGTVLQVYKRCQRVVFFCGHKIIVYHRILF